MTGIDYRLIDFIQQLRREQTKVVLERLQLVLALVGPVAVTQELAQRTVLIRQFVDPIEVGIQAQAQHAEHQDSPLLHPRATRIGVGLAFAHRAIRHDPFEYLEDPIPKRRLRVDVLQSAQDLRNVVARSRVQPDRANVHAVE